MRAGKLKCKLDRAVTFCRWPKSMIPRCDPFQKSSPPTERTASKTIAMIKRETGAPADGMATEEGLAMGYGEKRVKISYSSHVSSAIAPLPCLRFTLLSALARNIC